MNINIIKGFLGIAFLILVQIFVLNHIHLFGVATPLLYVYHILQTKRNSHKWLSITIAFLMGFVIDIFANTPGVTSASLTLIALLQPYLLRPFVPHESSEDLSPGMDTMGWAKYVTYALIVLIFYCLVFFSLEKFSFFNLLEWALCVVGSCILSLLLILVIEHVRSRP